MRYITAAAEPPHSDTAMALIRDQDNELW